MGKSDLVKKMIPIYLASCLAWMHNIVYTPLGYMYNTWPNQDALIMLIAVIPGIVAMGAGIVAGKLMDVMGRKNLVVLSMAAMLVGGMGMFFLGRTSIWAAIAFSGISGFAAGSIPAANFAALTEIAPENLRDKVVGWSDAVCSLGLVFAIFTCGLLASDGVWTRGYGVYFAVIPVLILVLLFYPKDTKSEAYVGAGNASAVETTDDAVAAVKSVLPGCIIALLVIKVFAGFFYASFGVFSSDYIINELQMGSSVLVGTVNTVTQVVNIVASAAVFLWIKCFKGFSSVVAQLVIGVSLVLLVMVGASTPGILACAAIMFVGLMSGHSSFSTIMATAPKGKAVGTVSGLFMSATFLGESLCGYVAPFFADLFLGSSSAGNCMKISGIMSIIIGIVSLPFFARAYKLAFPQKSCAESECKETIES